MVEMGCMKTTVVTKNGGGASMSSGLKQNVVANGIGITIISLVYG
jgi:hypothetical protein